MIRRYGTVLRALLMGADGILAALTALIVYELRFLLFPGDADSAFQDAAWAALVLYSGLWVIVLYLRGQYRLRAHWTVTSDIAGVVGATVWLAVISIVVLFIVNLSSTSRGFLLLLFPIQGLVTIATRIALRWVFMWARSRGMNRRNVLIVGTGDAAIAFADLVTSHSYLGLRVMGFVGDSPPRIGRARYLGALEVLEDILHGDVVDEVAVCLPASQLTDAQAVTALCQQEGKIVRIPLDITPLGNGRPQIEDIDGTVVLSLTSGPDQLVALAVKRLFDLVGASLGLVVLGPVLLFTAMYILARDGRPVLFIQTRVGVQGRPFRLYKFRTMVPDAEERYPEVAALNETQGPAFKMKGDPRITDVGKVLRRISIDELPQLWNVLKGDMSLVGPRPAPPREVRGYDLWHRRRLSMKPGITGLWQISSRLDRHFDERATLDLAYIDRWSLWLDLSIVARTIPAVLRQPGH